MTYFVIRRDLRTQRRVVCSKKTSPYEFLDKQEAKNSCVILNELYGRTHNYRVADPITGRMHIEDRI